MIFKFVIIGLLTIPIFGISYGSIEELGSILPSQESLTESWSLSNIEYVDDRAIGDTTETTDVVARQYLIRDQANENFIILVTVTINEFSSPSVSSEIFDEYANTMKELDGSDMDITDETGSGCIGKVQNKNAFNEVSTIACSVDEFIMISSAQQNGIVNEDGTTLSTAKISAAFTTFLIQNIRDFEHSALIPDWIKNNAKWWSNDTISDTEFVKAIEFLIKENIISVSSGPELSTFEQTIPSWIKTNAGWWADGTISDEEFLKSIQFLINNGIIVI